MPKPCYFKEHNVVFAKDQPQYLSLPAHKTFDGRVTTKWKFSWFERFRILLTGNLYLQVLTFNNPLQPLKLDVNLPDCTAYVNEGVEIKHA